MTSQGAGVHHGHSTKAQSWIVARYKLDEGTEEEDCHVWISLEHVRFRGIDFDDKGYLTKGSQAKLKKAMKGRKSKPKPKCSPSPTPPREHRRAKSSRRRTGRPHPPTVSPTPPTKAPRKANKRYHLRGTTPPSPSSSTSPSQIPPSALISAWGPRSNSRYNLRRR